MGLFDGGGLIVSLWQLPSGCADRPNADVCPYPVFVTADLDAAHDALVSKGDTPRTGSVHLQDTVTVTALDRQPSTETSPRSPATGSRPMCLLPRVAEFEVGKCVRGWPIEEACRAMDVVALAPAMDR